MPMAKGISMSGFPCSEGYKQTVSEGTRSYAKVSPTNNLSICYGLSLNKRCGTELLSIYFLSTLNPFARAKGHFGSCYDSFALLCFGTDYFLKRDHLEEFQDKIVACDSVVLSLNQNYMHVNL